MNYIHYPDFGIDLKIKIIQNALSGHLGFTNVDFYGRAEKVLAKDGKTFIPEVHISKDERKEVYYDDQNAPGGNVFFLISDEDTTKDGKQFTSKVKVVFMLNLDKIYENSTYRSDSQVQDKCMKLINRVRAMDVLSIERGIESVMKGYNIDNIKKNNLQPYHTFSVNGTISYTMACGKTVMTSSAPETPENPSLPVIQNNSQNNYATIGMPFALQISATNNPTSFGVWNLPEGLSVNSQTGLITGVVDENPGVISFSLMATNANGTGSSLFFLTKVTNDVSVLSPPINLSVTGYNPPSAGPSFMFEYVILPYNGQYEIMEVYKDGQLFRTFLNSLFPRTPGVQSDLTQSLEYGESYVFTLRMKNASGEFSAFSEPLNVTIPQP